MSKVIVVDECWSCPNVKGVWDGDRFLGYQCRRTWREDRPVTLLGVADWCPLPDLPERMETKGCYAPEEYFRRAVGWNACLDEIKGGREE